MGCPALHGCTSHRCVPAASLYSCHQPAPLVSADGPTVLLGRHSVLLNMSALPLLDEVRPSCSSTGYQPDAIFSFTVDGKQFEHGVGADFWLKGAVNADVDTLLEIRKDRCSDLPRTNASAEADALSDTAADALQGDDFVCGAISPSRQLETVRVSQLRFRLADISSSQPLSRH